MNKILLDKIIILWYNIIIPVVIIKQKKERKMIMNQNIENHNKKFHVGAVIQGAEILEILKYSKNGKSTQFLYRCPVCGQTFIGNGRITKLKTCSKCDIFVNNKKSNNKTEEYFYSDYFKNTQQIFCEDLGRNKVGGVYGIFTYNGVYIGESLDVKNRWKIHLDELKHNKHHNFLLQNYYNKGRALNFKLLDGIEIIKVKHDNNYKTKLKLLNLIKESEYIEYFSKNRDRKIFNIEYTLLNLMKNSYFEEMVNKFDSLNIIKYSQLIGLQNDIFISWEEFEKILKNRL